MRTVEDQGLTITSNCKNANTIFIMEKANTFVISGTNQNQALDNVKFYKN